jgi:hypothetical protein
VQEPAPQNPDDLLLEFVTADSVLSGSFEDFGAFLKSRLDRLSNRRCLFVRGRR